MQNMESVSNKCSHMQAKGMANPFSGLGCVRSDAVPVTVSVKVKHYVNGDGQNGLHTHSARQKDQRSHGQR